MGQKVNPKSFRLSLRRDWTSRWYADKEYAKFLEEDYRIRGYLKEKLRYAGVPNIYIERSGGRVRIQIPTARPGIIIGRKGQELDKIKGDLVKLTNRNDLIVDVHEIKKPDIIAQLVSENVALQLERRISFRRAMKKAVQTAISLGAKGIKIKCSGRLGGAEIARDEQQRKGSVPLHTLRKNVEYGFSEANTTYGKIGVKCWIYKDFDE